MVASEPIATLSQMYCVLAKQTQHWLLFVCLGWGEHFFRSEPAELSLAWRATPLTRPEPQLACGKLSPLGLLTVGSPRPLHVMADVFPGIKVDNSQRLRSYQTSIVPQT